MKRPAPSHVLAADARELEGARASLLAQRMQELAAEHVAGMLARHNEDALCSEP